MRFFAAAFLMAAALWGGNPRREELTIRIFDYASVPSDTLRQAFLVAQGIFGKAGIETTWLTCRPSVDERRTCDTPIQPTEVLLRVLAQSSDRKTLTSGALGLVLRNKQTATALYVFYGRVEHVAHFAPYDPSVLLGMVLTHEIGHFLGLDDSLGGIMRSSFHRIEMMQTAAGTLTFDQYQAGHLRASIAARMRQLQN
jgi:hypothetical protein